MARKKRFQLDDVCCHVVSRIAHRASFFDAAEKDIIVRKINDVEYFTGIDVISYAVMSNHIHLLLHINKPDGVKGAAPGEKAPLPLTPSRLPPSHDTSPALSRYGLTRDELVKRLEAVMRPRAFADLMDTWSHLTADAREREYLRHLTRMYNLSAFMKLLKQDISQYYNIRHQHTGALWEGRFKDTVVEPSIEALTSVTTYIDLNAWRAKIVEDPGAYRWCGWGAALAGDERRRVAYNFIYGTTAPWETLATIHRQQLERRMAGDSAEREVPRRGLTPWRPTANATTAKGSDPGEKK